MERTECGINLAGRRRASISYELLMRIILFEADPRVEHSILEEGIFRRASPEEFYLKIAPVAEEIKELLEIGFKCTIQKRLGMLRKRKWYRKKQAIFLCNKS